MSRPIKRSFKIDGHRTSISLEEPFWRALKDVAAAQKQPLSRLITRIDATRGNSGLSSAVRIWLLAHYREGEHREKESQDLST
jgi:predicted DNA-binding ribbon-helix-helix protein